MLIDTIFPEGGGKGVIAGAVIQLLNQESVFELQVVLRNNEGALSLVRAVELYGGKLALACSWNHTTHQKQDECESLLMAPQVVWFVHVVCVVQM